MDELTTISKAALANLEERLGKLAADKSHLQLVVQLMNRISAVPGLEPTVESMLRAVGDVIGGVQLSLYYCLGDALHYADLQGLRQRLDAWDDDLVRQAFDTREPVEREHPFSQTRMLTPEFTKAYTWAVPLLVGPEVVGVLKIEGLHLAMSALSEQLPTFFGHAALVLKNEIDSHLRQQEDSQLAAIVQSSDDAIIGKTLEGVITSWNLGAERMYGYTAAEMVGRAIALLSPAGQDEFDGLLARLRAGRQVERFETVGRRRDGREFHVSVTISPIRNAAGDLIGASTIARDITERVRAEAELRRLNRERRAISLCNQVLVRADDELELLQAVCRIVCDEAGYRMACVGYAEQDRAKRIRPVAWAGVEEGYLAQARLTWADTERGRGPAGTALRTGESTCLQDFTTDPRGALWREAAAERGYRSCLALPLKGPDAHAFGVLAIYSTEPNAFTPDELRLLEELSADLAFGITVLRARHERQRAEEALQQREAQLSESQRLAHIGSWDWDALSDVIWWSDEYYRIYGLEPQQPTPNYAEHLGAYTPDSAQRLDGLVRRAMATGEPYEVDLELAHPTSATHWIVARGEARRDVKGNICGLRGTAQNITDRKRAERERQSHLRFLEGMDQVFRAIQGTNDLQQMMEDVLSAALSIFDCDRAWLVYPCEPEAPAWQVSLERTRPDCPGPRATAGDVPMDSEVSTLMRTLRDSSGPVVFGPASERRVPPAVAQRSGGQSLLAMALPPKVGQAWLLGLHQCAHPRVWTAEEQALLQGIGRRLTDALTSLLMYRDLCQSEAENRALVNAVPDLLFRVDRDGIIVDFRKPESMDLYVPPDQFLGQTVTAVLPPAVAQATTAAIAKAVDTGAMATFEYDLVVDGRRGYFEARVVAFSNEEVLVVVRDLTDRKRAEVALIESEAKTRSILDNIGIGVALISPGLQLLELNRQMREWFPAAEPGQHPLCFRALNDPPHETVCDGCPAQQTMHDGLVHEATKQTVQGQIVRTYRLVSSPVLDATGAVSAAIELVEDITAQLSLESQLRQAQKMESVGRLAGGVAHDFNNMLGVILGSVSIAQEQVAPDHPLQVELTEILGAAKRSADLTRHLLAFARKQEIAPEELDLNHTIEGMLKMLQRLIGEDVQLSWRPAADLWPVLVDPSQIDQLLANLCVNARDAIQDVGRVTISTANLTCRGDSSAEQAGCPPGEYVRLAVSDTGCGMDQDTLEHIFEPFFTTKGVGQGTGLGLSTVYGIVKQNNGAIVVDSEPGAGTTFRIYLPRQVTVSSPPRLKDEEGPSSRGQETILLVEDEPTVLQLAARMLGRQGYTVLMAGTPDDALRFAREHPGPIHLLLTDVVMPAMNGPDLAALVLSIRPELKRLFMSGYTADVVVHHGVVGGAMPFLQKPFSKEALAAKVRETLDSQ